MNGLKEILVATTVAFACALSLARLTGQLKATRQMTPTEPTMISPAPVTPPASEVSLNWGLRAIHADQAWREGKQGSRSVTVAIVDTGCDINHPDLADNIWTNPGESGRDQNGRDKSSNGIDDDGNGFVDDVHGWNFVNHSPVIMDEHGHGTHIAGIIGSARLHGMEAGGVSPHVSLMILKYYDAESSGETNLAHTIEALRYAVKMGANIINYSGGGVLRNSAEEAAIAYAGEHGVLVVAAAGNEGLNSDFFHFYPADYEQANILSVAAVDRFGQLLKMSNYGRGTVDVAAPGRNIYSTLPGGGYGYMSGTSQSTAFVSGVAALMMAQDERYREPASLIRQLLAHGRPTPALKGRIGRGQMLDAEMALARPDLEISKLTDN